jgi:hypothetical protein
MKSWRSPIIVLLVGGIVGFALWTPALSWFLKSLGFAE